MSSSELISVSLLTEVAAADAPNRPLPSLLDSNGELSNCLFIEAK